MGVLYGLKGGGPVSAAQLRKWTEPRVEGPEPEPVLRREARTWVRRPRGREDDLPSWAFWVTLAAALVGLALMFALFLSSLYRALQ